MFYLRDASSNYNTNVDAVIAIDVPRISPGDRYMPIVSCSQSLCMLLMAPVAADSAIVMLLLLHMIAPGLCEA